jgi:hypothetical protein
MIVPLIKEYMEISVKNDEQLIKMATIIQRIFQTASTSGGNDINISEEEKAQLLAEIDKINNNK